MAKSSTPSQLLRENMADAPKGDWLDQVLRQLNSISTNFNNAIGGNLTLGENLSAQVIKLRVNVPSTSDRWDGAGSGGGGGVTGSGTSGSLAAWTGTSTVGNSTEEAWHVVGATGEPAFQNGWVNY